MSSAFPFDAVIFDLDGTLVATDQFWIPAARAATRRVFRERGITRPEPTGDEWMTLVGHPMAIGLRMVVPDLSRADLDALQVACEEEEERVLKAHGAQLLTGAREALETLVALEVPLGIASNCGRHYLEHMMSGLGLERWIQAARCLDTPGIRNKAEMVADLLRAFGAETGVMVGDRAGDMFAGRQSGLLCVGYTGAFGDAEDALGADLVIDDLAGLPDVLAAAAR
jgi:phosphoglycolate phosphatase-like HAD superfamily hydrolase